MHPPSSPASTEAYLDLDGDLLAMSLLRVIDEVDEVIRDPLCLRAHPLLANVVPRREVVPERQAVV